ncbi:MAG: DUF4491 family protein, partial [Anaerolineales bacterium]
ENMEINVLGLVAALTAFLTIWFGHVAVRRIEFAAPAIWLPAVIFTTLGLLTEYWSLVTENLVLKTALGIAGITFLFDAFELVRQQRRIRKGHAPANPRNPRHAAILAEPNSHATTLDLLKREPIGEPVNPDQAAQLVTEH